MRGSDRILIIDIIYVDLPTMRYVIASLLVMLASLNTAFAANQPQQQLECFESCLDALKEMKKYARNGSPHAQILLALTYKTGELEVAQDEDAAWKWMKRARSQSFPPAMYYSARWYREGYRTEVDVDKADEYLQRAATFGYAPAMYELGIRMLNKDQSSDGMRYIHAAADKNHARANRFLERIDTLDIQSTDNLKLDDTAVDEALVTYSDDKLITIKGSKFSPEGIFLNALAAIKQQAIYNDRGTTGSHLSDIKCGQPGSGCRVINMDDAVISADIWLNSSFRR
ncbi:MAG: tetratricopeptide repeat protein [Gammaproteobacteria bacterium]